jgi:hypothetical protein
MPRYEFRYTEENGQPRIVERWFKMSECPDYILVEEGDAVYRAERIMSLPAKMSLNWQVQGTDSGLPDERTPPND